MKALAKSRYRRPIAPLFETELFMLSSYRMVVVIADNEERKFQFEHYIDCERAMLNVAYRGEVNSGCY